MATDRGSGTATGLVGPDVELLYDHDKSQLPDGVWHPTS
jgi:hypothetical protein